MNLEYLTINPKAVVPTLVHNGTPVRESSIICDYIDELKSDPPLKPKNLIARAHLREWIKDSDEVGFPGIAALNFVTRFRSVVPFRNPRRTVARNSLILKKHYDNNLLFEEGMDSEWVLRGLVGWDRIFKKMEDTLSDGRPWIMGDSANVGGDLLRSTNQSLRHDKMARYLVRTSPKCGQMVGQAWQSAQCIRLG